MRADASYFAHLATRKLTGVLYRRFWLYPRLCRELSGRVLDVGCGLGQMVQFRRNTVGVDVDRSAVAWCQARGLDVQLMQPDHLPFDEGSFDGVVLDNVLEHIAAPFPLLKEIRRVLKPGGGFLVGVPSKKGFDADPDHKIFYDEHTLVEALSRAGFRREIIFHMPFRSDWLKERIRPYCIFGLFRRT